jgi:hypothetical protein
MSPAPSEAVLLLAAFLLVAGPLDEAKRMRASGEGVAPWVPFAVLTALGIASLLFGLFNPELITATFYEG